LHIGYFKEELDAALAYDEKAKELYKEFACLNFHRHEYTSIRNLYEIQKGTESSLPGAFQKMTKAVNSKDSVTRMHWKK